MVTGHRPQKLPAGSHKGIELELERLAVKLRDQHGMRVGISGMALGADIWWAQATVFAWQELWAFIPFPQQADNWEPADVALWQEMRGRATHEPITAPTYSVAALMQRNTDMVDNSDLVIAVYDPAQPKSGTGGTVRKAAAKMLPIIHLNPVNGSTTLLPPGKAPE